MTGVGALNIVLCSYSFLLTVLYIPQIFYGATNTRWAWLAVITPLLLIFIEKQKFTILHLIGLLFVLLASLSLSWAFNFYDAVDKLFKLLIVAQLFVLGNRLTNINLKWIFIGLAIGLTISIFNWPKGLYVNENMLAEASILTIVGLITFETWILVPFLLPNIVTGSRAVIVAALVSLTIFVWNKNKIYAIIILVLACLVGLASFLFDFRIGSIQERFNIWEDTINGLNWLGNGIGSFHSAFPFNSETMDTFKIRPMNAHNDYLQITFELGVLGLILAFVFVGILLKTNSNEKYIITTFLVLAVFSFPFYMPTTAFIFAIVAGHMSRNWGELFNTDRTSGISCLERI